MKKKNVNYSKENFLKLLNNIKNVIINNKKRIIGSTGVFGITAFITFTSAISSTVACTQEEMDAANELINQLTTEQTTNNVTTTNDVNVPMDTDKPEESKTENTTPVEPVTPAEEKQEEINPRDMKAVYGLDYDVPIYTEEEIEQAKSNLTSNYDDYIVKDWTEEWYNDDQRKEMAPDYYAANQDLFCQLNDMVSEFDGMACYNNGTRSGNYKIYYDETNDMYLKLDKDSLKFYNKKFEYTKQLGYNNFVVEIGNIADNGWMQVGPGSYAIISTIGSYEYGYTDKEIEYNDFGCDFKELEEYGFKPQKLNSEAVVIEDESYSLELK